MILSIFLYMKSHKNKGIILNYRIINHIAKPKNLGLFCGVFKNEKYSLFSMQNDVFVLYSQNKLLLKINVFINGKILNNKEYVQQDCIVFRDKRAIDNVELCVKRDNLSIKCDICSDIKIVINKYNNSYRITKNKIYFDNFYINFLSDNKYTITKTNNEIIYDFKQCKEIQFNYSSLYLKNVKIKENKVICKENFGLPILDFYKPDFSCVWQNNLKTQYLKACLKNIRYKVTDSLSNYTINLTKLGFSRWVKIYKYNDRLEVRDWITNYKIIVRTKAKNYYLACYFKEVFLCLDTNYTIQTIDWDKMFNGEVNLFKYKYNWRFFNNDMRFDFAYGMLCYMNKTCDSKYLKDKNIARFILNCLPKKLDNNVATYNFAKQIFPYIVKKELRIKLLLFIQNYQKCLQNTNNLI